VKEFAGTNLIADNKSSKKMSSKFVSVQE